MADLRNRLSTPFAALAFAAIAAFCVVTMGETPKPPALARPGGSVAPPGAAGVFAKGPYLQALGPTGVTVKFELASPSAASVAVVPAGAAAGAAAVASRGSAEALSFHVLHVDGLSPATAYDYRVTAGGAVSEPGHFTTAPADTRPFRFLVYGDSRNDHEAHAAVIRAMEAVPSDFLVNTGDMVAAGNDPREWAELFSIEGRLLRDRCAFVAVGNHELSRGDHAGEVAFLRYFAAEEEGRDVEHLYGSFRWSNTRFFVLNAMDTWTGDERAWLRAELDRAASEPGVVHRIALMHWGPYSSGPHGNNPALQSGEVTAMMREHKVDLVLAGHDHVYERGDDQGLKYVISGGAGAPLYPKKFDAPQTRHFESTYNFVEAVIDGDRVSLTARRPTGGILETCGYQGGGPWDCDPPRPAALKSDASRPPTPVAASRACGCAVPGAPGEGGAVVLAFAVALAWSRRRRQMSIGTSTRNEWGA